MSILHENLIFDRYGPRLTVAQMADALSLAPNTNPAAGFTPTTPAVQRTILKTGTSPRGSMARRHASTAARSRPEACSRWAW